MLTSSSAGWPRGEAQGVGQVESRRAHPVEAEAVGVSLLQVAADSGADSQPRALQGVWLSPSWEAPRLTTETTWHRHQQQTNHLAVLLAVGQQHSPLPYIQLGPQLCRMGNVRCWCRHTRASGCCGTFGCSNSTWPCAAAAAAAAAAAGGRLTRR